MAVPPDFVAGQVLTAAQMNSVGSWLIKTQTIGTAVSSVQVTDAFSADYQNYRIVVAGGSCTNDTDLRLTLGATASGYYYFMAYGNYDDTAVQGVNGENVASWAFAGTAGTATNYLDAHLFMPFEAKKTMIHSKFAQANLTGASGVFQGNLNNTTSYTSFTLTLPVGTMTGGTIYVYGLRD
jgi:hypothetical protein